MIKEAIEKVLSLAPVQLVETGGRVFTSRKVDEVEPFEVRSITVHTLQAVVDFFEERPDSHIDIEPRNATLHVADPYTVHVVEGCADDTYRTREHYLTAVRIHEEFSFGTWFDQEKMVINLMTLFEQTETLKEIIRAVSGLVSNTDVTINDDGVSQEVKVRKGVQRIESTTIQNPIMLQPIRTFTEIEQVEAPYVLRIKTIDGVPHVAIFEAGGGQWKNEAIARIKRWLDERIDDVKILG